MSELLLLILVFVGSTGVAYWFIRRIPTKLHTPLMSMTNAISAVTLLGALLVFGMATAWWEALAGAAALVTASFNLVGGFALTHRMLRMFKEPKGGGCEQRSRFAD